MFPAAADVRYLLILLINFLKAAAPVVMMTTTARRGTFSSSDIPWHMDFDPFHVLTTSDQNNHMSPLRKLILVAFSLLLVLSLGLVSIKIPFTSPIRISVRIDSFSPSVVICFLASVFLPHALFSYLIVLLFILFSPSLDRLISSLRDTIAVRLAACPAAFDIPLTDRKDEAADDMELQYYITSDLEEDTIDDGMLPVV